MAPFAVATLTDRPDLLTEIQELGGSAWPDFLTHDATVNEWWHFLWDLAPDYQFALIDRSGAALACGNAIPIVWNDGETLPPHGIDAVLPAGIEALRRGDTPTAVSALQIVVRRDMRGEGLSAECLQAMREIAAAHGMPTLVAPVRPTCKDRYPLIPLERYARWRRPDGSLFDPWLRVHERAGAESLGVAPASMQVIGTVAEWKGWTDMSFPGSGRYVVPGAHAPVDIDLESNQGVYVEPNFWMSHSRAPVSPT
jgi:GNAT superfamily N-acetyltransferase